MHNKMLVIAPGHSQLLLKFDGQSQLFGLQRSLETNILKFSRFIILILIYLLSFGKLSNYLGQ